MNAIQHCHTASTTLRMGRCLLKAVAELCSITKSLHQNWVVNYAHYEVAHGCLPSCISRHSFTFSCLLISSLIYPLTARVVGAPQMISQPVYSIFLCSPQPSGTCRTPGLSIPWCCLPTSSSVYLVFFSLLLCLARWFWPDLMNGRHDHTTAVCVFLLYQLFIFSALPA